MVTTPRTLLTVLTLLFPLSRAHDPGNGDFCGTVSPSGHERRTLEEGFRRWKHHRSLEKISTNYSIPVQFTVFEAEDGRGNISDDKILELLDALDVGFQMTPFRFYSNGLPKRAQNDTYFKCDPDYEKTFTSEFREGGRETLNIYLCNLFAQDRFGVFGVSTFPREDLLSNDGVLLMNPILPKEGVTFDYMEGIITHEVGHWLGLYHTFEGGCDPFQGDAVSDTPAHARQTSQYADPSSNCWQSLPGGPLDTCPDDVRGVDPGVDPVDNFMNYIPYRGTGEKGQCYANHGRFTPGQVDRMTMMYERYRQLDDLPPEDDGNAPKATSSSANRLQWASLALVVTVACFLL